MHFKLISIFKNSLSFFVFLSFFLLTPSQVKATAFNFEEPIVIDQGKTVEFLIPKRNITSISGNYKSTPIVFFETTQKVDPTDYISRGEFLDHLIKNLTTSKFIEANSGSKTALENFSKTFEDVPSSHPYYNSIHKAYQLGLVDGYEVDGLFHPEDPLTRSQIAKILTEALEIEEFSTQDLSKIFPDLTKDHPLYNYISKAYQAKIFQGYQDGLLRPNKPLAFFEAELVLERSLEIEELQITNQEQSYFRGFLGLHRTKDLGDDVINFSVSYSDEEKQFQKPISVLKSEFPTHSFNLAASKTKLFGSTEQDTTWSQIYGAMENPHPDQLWQDSFIIPAEGEITLTFGDHLYINGSYSGSHFGLDYANVEGTSIYASNKGIVKLSEWTPSYGNTVLIDHGQNVFTMYLHLSALEKSAGDHVEKGDLIGKMGDTGIATGSHLHFTHFIGKTIVDSEEWYNGNF